MSVESRTEVQTSEILQDTMPSSTPLDTDGEMLTHDSAPYTLAKIYRYLVGISKAVIGEATRRNSAKRVQGFEQILTGSITTSSTAVTGASTLFLTELYVGAFIAGTAGEYREIAAISSDTSLTLVLAFSSDIGSSQKYTRLQMLSERLDAMEKYVNAAQNGELSSWNQGTSFSSPASDSQLADNFYARYDGSIGTFAVTQNAFTLGQTNVPGEPQYNMRWNQTAAGSAQTYKQLRVKVLGVRSFAGQNLQITFYAQMGSQADISVGATQYFGAGGSPDSDVTVTAKARTILTTFSRHTVSLAIPSITGKSLGSNSDDALYVVFNLPLNATHDFYLSNVSVYEGTAELPFKEPVLTVNVLTYLWAWILGKLASTGAGTPVGTYIQHAGSAAPAGFLACDGASLLRAGTYADLFAVIGTTYGAADGTHFTLPNARGLVMVGAGAHGTMTRANGTAYNGGTVGATRNDQMQGHIHETTIFYSGTFGTSPYLGTTGASTATSQRATGGPLTDASNGTPRTGDETRPAEIAVLVCIKY